MTKRITRTSYLRIYRRYIPVIKTSVAECKRCGEPIFNIGEHLVEACKGNLECRRCYYRNAPDSVLRQAAMS